MPKPHLRPALAGVWLLAAAPAAGQSLERRILDAQNALHHVEDMRASIREGSEQREREAAERVARWNAGMARETAILLEQVRAHCVTDTGRADVAPFVPTNLQDTGVMICGVLQAERRRAEAAR